MAAVAMAVPVVCGCATTVPADGPRAAGTPTTPATTPATTPTTAPATGPAPASVPASPALPTGPPSASPPVPNAAATGCVSRTLAGMSATERAAQLLLVGVDATAPAARGAGLARLGVGGVFLRGRVAGSSALRSQVAAVQTAGRRAGAPTLFVAVDEEGGAVQTVRGGTIPPFPSARVQGTWSTRTLRLRTAAWARELARLGVNLDLAPVADVVPTSIGTRNPPIGRYGRQYGSTPAAVSPRVAAVVAGLRSAGVGPTVKHFPGLGRVLVNTDTGRGATDPATTPNDPALQPFTAGTRAGAVAVMVSSALYPRLDRRNLAVFSPAVVTGLLRGRLGWTGMVVTDDLGQAVAVSRVPVGRRATSFLAAGGDLVLTVVPAQATTMRAAIVARAASDPAFRARVTDAVTRVLTAKQALGLLRCG